MTPFPNGSRYYKEQYKYLRNDLRQAISTYYLSDLQEFRFSCKNPTISDPGVPPIVPLFFGMVPLNKRFRVGQRCSFVYAGNLDARPRSAQLSICFLAFSSTALRFATWANCTKCLPSSCFHGLAHSGRLWGHYFLSIFVANCLPCLQFHLCFHLFLLARLWSASAAVLFTICDSYFIFSDYITKTNALSLQLCIFLRQFHVITNDWLEHAFHLFELFIYKKHACPHFKKLPLQLPFPSITRAPSFQTSFLVWDTCNPTSSSLGYRCKWRLLYTGDAQYRRDTRSFKANPFSLQTSPEERKGGSPYPIWHR